MFFKGNKKQDKSIISWTDESIAFDECKQLLANSSNSGQLSIMVDASVFAIGAVLQQMTEIGWQQLGYFSRNNRHRKNTARTIASYWRFMWP